MSPSSDDMPSRKNGRLWKFINDGHLVGELTKVVCKIAGGSVFKGWAQIFSHRYLQVPGGQKGMGVAGPVFSAQNRDTILDGSPRFERVDHLEPNPDNASTHRCCGKDANESSPDNANR